MELATTHQLISNSSSMLDTLSEFGLVPYEQRGFLNFKAPVRSNSLSIKETPSSFFACTEYNTIAKTCGSTHKANNRGNETSSYSA